MAFGLLALHARADTFDFSFSVICEHCGPFVGSVPANLTTDISGVFRTTNTEVNGALTIIGITGSRTTNWYLGNYLDPPVTSTITGLIPPDPTNPYGLVVVPDNLIYPNRNPYLDGKGFAYTLGCCNGPDVGQIVSDGPGNYVDLGPSSLNAANTFTLTPVPEPTYSLAFFLIAAASTLVYILNRSALCK